MNDSKKNVRLPIMVTEAEEKAIDDWRFAHRVESRAEAMRQLIARGLRPDSPAGEAAPAPVRQGRKRPPIDVARVRPYPAKAIAEMAKGGAAQLNVKIPERLKAQLDWIAEAPTSETKQRSIRLVVTEMLQAGVDDELAAAGVRA